MIIIIKNLRWKIISYFLSQLSSIPISLIHNSDIFWYRSAALRFPDEITALCFRNSCSSLTVFPTKELIVAFFLNCHRSQMSPLNYMWLSEHINEYKSLNLYKHVWIHPILHCFLLSGWMLLVSAAFPLHNPTWGLWLAASGPLKCRQQIRDNKFTPCSNAPEVFNA